jgi:Domain of unknown function (DUF4149)
MLALRYAAVLALVFWTGGLVVLGALAAPAVFDVLGARGPEGRVLAGAVFGEILERFHTAAYICGGVIAASLTIRAVLGPRPRRFAIRVLVAALMVGATVYSGLALLPRIEAARTGGLTPSLLPEGDPRRTEFGRLHGLSTSLQLVPVLGGLVLLLFELRD